MRNGLIGDIQLSGRYSEYESLVRALRCREADIVIGEELLLRLEPMGRPDAALYRLLFRSIDEPLGLCEVICGENGQPCDFRRFAVNPAYERLIGLSHETAPGRRALDMAPDPEKVWAEIYGRILFNRKGARFEHHCPSTDRWFEIHAFWVDENIFAGLFTDVTERRRIQTELTDKTLEADRRAQQLGELTMELIQAEQRERKRLAGVLHDHLQQLLVAAKFQAEGILGDSAEEPHAAALGEISCLLSESIQASKRLTMELCPPVLYEAGLGAGLRWLADWMREKHGLEVRLDLEQSAEPKVEEVRILLFESVRELLFNVVKHSQVKQATVAASGAGPDYLQLVVSDNGIGFDPQAVWDSADRSGRGFGLFSIRQRLDLLGGRLEVDSGSGRGSRFTLVLPAGDVLPAVGCRRDQPRASRRAEREAAGLSSALRSEGKKQGKIRVLIADDQMIMRRGLGLLLGREEDFDLIGEAGDGLEAVELSQKLRPDAVVMDIRMPRMNGIEATRQIRDKLPGVRVLAFSNYEEPEIVSQVFEAGASAFVHKGRRLETMLMVLRSIAAPA